MPVRALNDELQKKSQEELNEVPGQVKENLERIKEWVSKQPHLNCRLDDQWLISFLRGCKFSIEKTKEKLEYFYTIRTIDAQIFKNRDPFCVEIQEMLTAGYILPLPKPQDPKAPRTILIHTPNYDPDTMTSPQAIKAFLMGLDVLLNTDDNFVIAGQQVLFNVAGFDYRMMLQLMPNLRKITAYLLSGYPARPKDVHVLNSPPLYEKVVSILQPLLPDKINRRIKFYKDDEISDIYKSIPREILPTEYGGTAGTIRELAAQWRKTIESYDNWFKEDAQYGVEENKRIAKPRSSSDLVGVEGSFRSLTID